MPCVEGENAEIKTQCGGSDREIFERDANAAGCLFAFNLASELRHFECDRVNRNVAEELFCRPAPAFAVHAGLGAIDTVG